MTASSILAGTVKRPRNGATPQNGTTAIQSITGLGAAQNRLTNPPFILASTALAAVVDAALESFLQPLAPATSG